jgi:hypothetical protein
LQIELYVDYYAQHFKDNATTGKLDIFPAQALETWQCKTVPATRSDCVTNPMPEIAGLRAVLPRLLAYDNTVVTAAMQTKWRALMKRVPALPVGPCSEGHGKPPSTPGQCLQPGARLPSKPSNAENADLYAVHPFRQVGLYSNRVRMTDSI